MKVIRSSIFLVLVTRHILPCQETLDHIYFPESPLPPSRSPYKPTQPVLKQAHLGFDNDSNIQVACITNHMTRYHVEAADNAKFLAVLEKCSHAIYLEVFRIQNWSKESNKYLLITTCNLQGTLSHCISVFNLQTSAGP